MPNVIHNPDSDWIAHAIGRYFRSAGETADRPSTTDSRELEVDGTRYVVLANVRGILAVYRISEDGKALSRILKRWPSALNKQFA